MSAIRGRLVWYEADPEIAGPSARRYHEDGLLVVADGLIHAVGEAVALLPTLPDGAPVHDHRPHLVSPGFIDPHIHFPQTQVIASYGTELLDWLARYTFVEEQRFADPAHAAANATFFLDELLRNGTTTACAFCTVDPASAEALFAEAERRNRAAGRRKGHDGSRRAARSRRHGRAELWRDASPDRALARAWTSGLRHLASLRPDLDRGATRSRRHACPRAPRLPRPNAPFREPARD
jgi:cytosine/adenosine deaminase-related metal-dependent hydrolase